MSAWRRTHELVRNLHAILGGPGLMIGVFAIVSFGFGLYVLVREYDRPRETGRRSVHRVLDHWARSPDYLGLTLLDHADLYRRATEDERPLRQKMLRHALDRLGSELDRFGERFPLIHVTRMDVGSSRGGTLAVWPAQAPVGGPVDDGPYRIPLTPPGESPALELRVRYSVAPAFDEGVRGLETSYHRLLMALIGLSGFSLLCIGYMVLHARALSERVAREAAQEATLDLADRTCHELGNGVFVLTNERRNLAEHLDLVERFIAEGPAAREAAARRAGLEPESAARWHHALKREYAARGIDPDLELRGSAALARHVCRQIDVCSEYIRMTVHELDGFLKRSELPVDLARVDPGECLDEALALLRPRLEASDVRVSIRTEGAEGLRVRAVRRLLIHALVNLLKNAVEAAEGAAASPEVVASVRVEGRTAWIGVADNGPGIPSDDLGRVFEVGFTTKGTGRGRGLAIVRESVHIQEGEILVANRPGGGASFQVGLEIASEPSASAPAIPAEPSAADGAGRTSPRATV